MRFLKAILIALVVYTSAGSPSTIAAKDKLVIGITQFPSTFHPNIDSMAAKSYILAMTARPFTVFDANWELICMLCTELPTLENGLAKKERTPGGKQGIAVTYSIQPKALWGDGVAVSTKDVLFTWKVGRHPKSSVGNMELYRSIYKIDVKDEKTFTFHFDKLRFYFDSSTH
jgi:peptide/nickel transport system substrate-binding protein